MESVERAFVSINRALLVAAFSVMFVIVMVNVIGRYVFGVSFAWVEETARYLMIFGAFAGAGLALREGRLVAIHFLVDQFPKWLASIIVWGGIVLMFAFACALIYYGALFVEFGWSKETMATGVPRGLPYLAIPIGMSLFLIHLAFFAKRYAAGAFEIEQSESDEESAPSEGRS